MLETGDSAFTGTDRGYDVLEIRLMGDVSVLRDGEPLELPQSRKTLALLAYLAVTQRRHHRDHLCSLLWENPDDPRGALRWSLSKLRSMLDETDSKRIVGDRNTVAVDLLDAKVDVLLLREAIESEHENSPTEGIRDLADSITGSFMENLELPECHGFHLWQRAERSELATLNLKLLTTLCQSVGPEDKNAKRYERSLERVSSEFPDEASEILDAARPPAGMLEVHDKSGNIQLPDRPSIAVLPFQNLSGMADQDYFVDGMTEDVIVAMSRATEFFVISPSSTFTYKGQQSHPSTVARELGVHYVLEGSVKRSDTRVRVNVQLVEGATGNHLWAEQYDAVMADIFSIQDDMTRKISARIGPEVLSAEMKRANRSKLPNPNAREYFLRGMWHFAQTTEHGMAEALKIAESGIEKHPEDAELHTLLALANILNFIYGWQKPRLDSLGLAVDAARRAVEIDAFDPRVYRCMGVVDLYAKRHENAVEDLHRTIALNPNDSDGHSVLGGVLGYSGDYEGALKNIQQGVRLSPRDPFLFSSYNYMAHAATVAGRDDVALEWSSRVRREMPGFPGGLRILAVSHVHLGHLDKARTEIQELLELAPHTTLEDVRLTVPIKDEAAMARYLEALRQAGLPDA